MTSFKVEGLIKGYPSRWVIWTTLGSYAVKDFGSVGEGMLNYASTVEANSEAEAIAVFVSTYFPLSEDGPEVVKQVLLLKRAFTIMFEWVMFEHGTQGKLASRRTEAVGLGLHRRRLKQPTCHPISSVVFVQ